LSLEHGC